MGNVKISPSIKKESVRIDTFGNIINPSTKEILVPKEKEYEEPGGSVDRAGKTEGKTEGKAGGVDQQLEKPGDLGSKIDAMIKLKIEEIVAKKIEDAFKNL